MKNLSLAAAAAIVLLANVLGLVHAARNRSGSPEAEVTLTQRELRYFGHPAGDDDSGVTLQIMWNIPNWSDPNGGASDWLDRKKLQELGFDCRVDPESPEAEEFYRRQRLRQVFVARENDGGGRRRGAEAHERVQPEASRLVAIDADLDAARLRARNPDRSRVVIVPAAIGTVVNTGRYARGLYGSVRQIPATIYVPRPFSDLFRAHGAQASYRVHLRYGQSFEPWITGVDFTPAP
jgi:hypothetical protein